ELRVGNVSYAKIAEQIKVSKTTLINWAKDCEPEIQNRRAITYEALNEKYKAGQQHRLQMWSEQLEAVREELKKRGLGDVPTVKLVEMLDTLCEKLNGEAYKTLYIKVSLALDLYRDKLAMRIKSRLALTNLI